MSAELTLQDLKNDIDAVGRLTKSLEDKLGTLQNAISEIDNKVTPLDKKVSGILASNVTINKNVSSIKNTTESHTEKYTNLESAISGLKNAMVDAQNFVKEIEVQQQRNVHNIDTLSKDKEAIRKELITHIGRVNEQFNKVKNACEKVNIHDDKIDEIRKINKLGIITAMTCAGLVTFIVFFQALGIWDILAKYIQGFAK